MPEIRRKGNDYGSTYCPLMTVADVRYARCEPSCAWYVDEPGNDDYSGCAVPKMLLAIESALSELRG